MLRLSALSTAPRTHHGICYRNQPVSTRSNQPSLRVILPLFAATAVFPLHPYLLCDSSSICLGLWPTLLSLIKSKATTKAGGHRAASRLWQSAGSTTASLSAAGNSFPKTKHKDAPSLLRFSIFNTNFRHMPPYLRSRAAKIVFPSLQLLVYLFQLYHFLSQTGWLTMAQEGGALLSSFAKTNVDTNARM